VHAAEQPAVQAAVGLGLKLEDAAFHAGDPALAAGDAGQHLVALPDLVLAIGRCQRCNWRAGMSTQYRACSPGATPGFPRALRASTISSQSWPCLLARAVS
jgi:hypothetical protein